MRSNLAAVAGMTAAVRSTKMAQLIATRGPRRRRPAQLADLTGRKV
jgi:hypothetical protein